MEIAVKTLSLSLNPKIISYKQVEDVFIPNLSCNRACFPPQKRYRALKYQGRERHVHLLTVHAVSSDLEDVGVSSQFEDFNVTTASINENRELKISVEISGAKTRAIFDDVFDKMVAAAQPIPGFRRVKGGKTPNIPRDILLEVLGASKVYKQVITKVINSTVAEYVEKQRLHRSRSGHLSECSCKHPDYEESLAVGKDLRVEQSFEDLEEMFEPDEKFRFDAVIKLQETN
ncbi:Transport, ribosome-binding, bacterial, putative isoform 1 [Theobroma cacao]|uniref:peptidylprolyl isomerase n=1 Tax=Theobroma cacao TaxID=3641 RepID=A0A061EIA3_THECC|nr:Transport, ribosome-binding, bacterial, putative isoform 1 [Theobroma cacao]